MGLHTGVGTLSEGHYVGMDVHRAARIAAAGHGGQVLLSQSTYDQVAKELAAQQGTGLRDLGKHRLKDLPRREELYQLVLPGLPTDYPPLKTLDAWPGLRADLSLVVLLSSVLLAVVGLVLPLVDAVFPRVIGLVAAGLAGLILATSAVARPLRNALVSQWRTARKPFAGMTSGLLSLVVVLTTLFITKPPLIIKPNLPYDFSYTYHTPTKHGGTVTIGVANYLESVASPWLNAGLVEQEAVPIWDSCVVELPDLTLRLADGWKADQCTAVPTTLNNGESSDYKVTTFHIDPRAVWSDGVPITADDYLFSARIATDPAINGNHPWDLMQIAAPDPNTVEIHWSEPYTDYLNVLASWSPIPLHVYASGAFAGVYDPKTGSYNSALAQQLQASASFNTTIPVDNGPFTVQSFVPDHQAVLVKNPRFFSNFFHTPTLDQVKLVSMATNVGSGGPSIGQWQADVLASYRRNQLTLAEGLNPQSLSQMKGIPTSEVITSPVPSYVDLAFNLRTAAPNAQANGGGSIFNDHTVRQAFVEAFDRCAAVHAQLGDVKCGDRNLFTDEFAVPPEATFDPSYAQPKYNPTDAAQLLDRAGYPVIDGIRRYKDRTTPLRLTLVVTPGVHSDAAIAQQIQHDYTRNLQIGVTIVNTLSNTLWNAQTAPPLTGAFDLMLLSLEDPVDPVGRLSGLDATNIPSVQEPTKENWFGIIDPYVNQQDQKGSMVLDTDTRSLLYRDLYRYYAKQFYAEPVYIAADVSLVKPTLCNFKKWPDSGSNLWNMADWYVAPSCPS
jgi:ABC-type transport system substrate-binding protein